jgi:hypothetical protein
MIYGDLPEDLGLIDLSPVEMLFWLYCPVMTPTSLLTLPPNLAHFRPIVEAVLDREGNDADGCYIYLTAKTLWLAENGAANRPGWHADGFGTDDRNYIWYDRAPTEFFGGTPFELGDDCADAMAEMERRAVSCGERWHLTYPAKHLLRLTPSVVHRVPERFPEGMRTFVKVSVSRDRYNLAGNSVNHALGETWPMLARAAERNHPHAGMAADPPPESGASDRILRDSEASPLGNSGSASHQAEPTHLAIKDQRKAPSHG